MKHINNFDDFNKNEGFFSKSVMLLSLLATLGTGIKQSLAAQTINKGSNIENIDLKTIDNARYQLSKLIDEKLKNYSGENVDKLKNIKDILDNGDSNSIKKIKFDLIKIVGDDNVKLPKDVENILLKDWNNYKYNSTELLTDYNILYNSIKMDLDESNVDKNNSMIVIAIALLCFLFAIFHWGRNSE